MLAIPLKKSDTKLDIVKVTAKYIAGESHWGQDAADSCSEALTSVQSLRDKARVVAETGGKSARDQLFKYAESLQLLHSRVNISSSNAKLQIPFTWTDAYSSGKKYTQKNASFERAALLFNFGAVLSHEACARDRTNDTGLKEAYNLFAEAVGVFDFIKAEVCKDLSQPLSPDISEDGLNFASALMTAQAQQCFYLKASMGGMSRAVLAKLAQGTADAYSLAAGMIDTPTLKAASSMWKSRLQCSTQWFMADAEYKISIHEQEQMAIGNEIARLQRAEVTMGTTAKYLKYVPAEQQEELAQLRDQIAIALQVARQDNEIIFKLTVPTDIAAPEGKLMVKPKVSSNLCMACRR